ncbi:MAG: hypothetical protein ACXWLM_13105, partial [Myxococcales bacterium]
MGWICACCFAVKEGAAEGAKCSRCDSQECGDCSHDKVLLEVEAEEGAKPPDVETEEYADFLQRFEDAILPAYRAHFENDVRKRWRTRLEVCRAMILSQAMLNYRRDACGEKDVSAAEVRYAVALRSFGKLKKDPKEPVVFLDVEKKREEPLAVGRGGWAHRSAACAYAYLSLIQVPEAQAKKIASLLLESPETMADDIVRDAFALDRLRKLVDEKQDDANQFLAEASKALKGRFSFMEGEDQHGDAREALIVEAGLLMK